MDIKPIKRMQKKIEELTYRLSTVDAERLAGKLNRQQKVDLIRTLKPLMRDIGRARGVVGNAIDENFKSLPVEFKKKIPIDVKFKVSYGGGCEDD